MEFKNQFKKSILGIKIVSVMYYVATIIYLGIGIISFFMRETLMKIPEFSSIKIPLDQAAIIIGTTFILLAIFTFFVSTGLIKKQSWARKALILFTAINGIGGLTSVLEGNYLSLISFTFNIGLASYLIINKKIKNQFHNRSLVI